jgi:C1A family cysteine protease
MSAHAHHTHAHLPRTTVPRGAYVAAIDVALGRAARLGRLNPAGPTPIAADTNGIFSLAQYQSPAELQGDRGSCWAFAGAAALEAAYIRKFGHVIDIAEQYVFHMGKAFALNRDAAGNAATPVENNTSLTGSPQDAKQASPYHPDSPRA